MSKQQLLSPNLDAMRMRYNMLSGLDAPRLVNMLNAATDRGEMASLQWMLHRAIQRWPILRSLRTRRASALLRKEWDIQVQTELPPGTTDAQAVLQVKALREAYDRIDNLSGAFNFLASAEFTGFAHMQKHRDADGNITHLEPLDQWCWVRDGYRGQWYWNPTAEGFNVLTLKQRPESNIDPAEFVIREVEFPIYESALPLYLTYSLAKKDWSAYVEIFGIPRPFVVAPEIMTDSKAAEMLEAAQSYSDGTTVVFPFGSTATYPAESRSEPPFLTIIEKCEKELCIAVTGGLLSMLSEPTGIGKGASDAHQDAFNELAEGEAKEISEVFQRSIDAEILDAKFPGQPRLAYFRLAGKDEVDITAATTQIQSLATAGWTVDPEQIQEVTGWKVVEKPQVMPSYSLGGAQAGDGKPGDANTQAYNQDAPMPKPDTQKGDANAK